jgi:hypothetical protein
VQHRRSTGECVRGGSDVRHVRTYELVDDMRRRLVDVEGEQPKVRLEMRAIIVATRPAQPVTTSVLMAPVPSDALRARRRLQLALPRPGDGRMVLEPVLDHHFLRGAHFVEPLDRT